MTLGQQIRRYNLNDMPPATTPVQQLNAPPQTGTVGFAPGAQGSGASGVGPQTSGITHPGLGPQMNGGAQPVPVPQPGGITTPSSIADLTSYVQGELRKIKQTLDSISAAQLTWKDISGLTSSEPNAIVNVADFGAVGNGANNDQPAIQAALNFVNSKFGGGIVLFPAGAYLCNTGLTVNGCTTLQGMGVNITNIFNLGTDLSLITFPANCDFGGARDIKFQGFNNAAATLDVVTVVSNNLIIRDCQIQFGRYGLNVTGGACVFDNLYVEGYTGSVLSNFSNWYLRCILDNALAGSTYMFHQVAGAGLNENHFWACDFSNVSTNSILINDAQSIAKFHACIFAQAIQITNHQATAFNGCQFGSTTFNVANGGPVLVNGCIGQAVINITVAGTATKILAGNTTNIT